jgi:beta-xylosidase
MKLSKLIVAFLLCGHLASAQQEIKPGVQWNDTKGSHINAHGGCVVYDKGNYYWFGEDRTGMVSNGVSCYKSKDLYQWERAGLALKTEGAFKDDMQDVGKGRTLERPKVIYNPKINKWVMWAHWEKGDGYEAARVMVATSDRVEGPYIFEQTFRPNAHDSRDQTVFVDKDGKAYHFFFY